MNYLIWHEPCRGEAVKAGLQNPTTKYTIEAETLYKLQVFALPTFANKKQVTKEIMQTEKKLVSFRDDLECRFESKGRDTTFHI